MSLDVVVMKLKALSTVEIYDNCVGVIPNPAWRVFRYNGRYETNRTAHSIHSLPRKREAFQNDYLKSE